jgi:hypothetical protein
MKKVIHWPSFIIFVGIAAVLGVIIKALIGLPFVVGFLICAATLLIVGWTAR